MANDDKKNSKKKKSKRSGGSSNFLRFGKFFLVILFFVAQGFLAYAVVDKYYPEVYKKMNEKTPADFVPYELEEMVVNPAQTNGKRYLLVQISLELDDPEHVTILDKNKNKLKQDIIEALSKRTIPELVKVDNRENLRLELIQTINSIIGERSVRNLYFIKYVMQ